MRHVRVRRIGWRTLGFAAATLLLIGAQPASAGAPEQTDETSKASAAPVHLEGGDALGLEVLGPRLRDEVPNPPRAEEPAHAATGSPRGVVIAGKPVAPGLPTADSQPQR